MEFVSQNTSQPRLLVAAEIEDFFEILASRIEPKAELNWQTPLDLLIAVVLSAQTTDKAVNKVTESLWDVCRVPQDYLDLGQEKLAEHLKTIGLWRVKARSVIGLCQCLRDQFANQVPGTREELQTLPGVGRKTANVVLNVAFGQETLAVDTHIFRVGNRTGLVQASTPEKTELALLKKIPARYLRDAHHYLLLHGRYTCKARQPECPRCPVSHICRYKHKVGKA
jgi:endonuclease-3